MGFPTNEFKSVVRSLPVLGPIARRCYRSVFASGGLVDHLRYVRYSVLGGGWVSVAIDGATFEFRCRSVSETRRAIVGMRTEHAVLAELRSLCSRGMVVYDVGANVGTHTLALADAAGPGGVVVSFEPHAKSYAALIDNVSRNGLENVVTKNAALGPSTGTAELHVEKNETGVGSHSLVRRSDSLDTTEEIDVICGDEYTEDVEEGPDLIKIDVEGGELDVLEGLTNTVREYEPLLVVEIHDVVEDDSIYEFLREHDYAFSQSDSEKDIVIARPA